ncbi:hypothetical protein ACFQZ4_18420 [Catellatospora coxensis]
MASWSRALSRASSLPSPDESSSAFRPLNDPVRYAVDAIRATLPFAWSALTSSGPSSRSSAAASARVSLSWVLSLLYCSTTFSSWSDFCVICLRSSAALGAACAGAPNPSSAMVSAPAGASRRAAARRPLPWGMTRYGWPFSAAAYRVS